MATGAELQQRFSALAATSRARAPRFARLCDVIGQSAALSEVLAAAPATQQSPVLLLAAIHAEVLTDPACELAGWFPTVTATARDDDPTTALERLFGERADALRHTVATRVTQTNEVGRCGLLVPALGLIAAEVGPLGLLDVGTSAGLNLRLARYAYRYQPGGAVGGPSPVELVVACRGAVPVPPSIPEIGDRLGLDQFPLDPANAEDATWLRACVWPDQLDRFARLDAALAIAAADPVTVRTGDAVDDLAAAVEALASGSHPVVLNTWVLSYLTAEGRSRYLSELRRIATRRDLSWVFAESPQQTAGLPYPADLAGVDTTALTMVRWRGGREHVTHLGRAHPHGYWLHWDGRPQP